MRIGIVRSPKHTKLVGNARLMFRHDTLVFVDPNEISRARVDIWLQHSDGYLHSTQSQRTQQEQTIRQRVTIQSRLTQTPLLIQEAGVLRHLPPAWRYTWHTHLREGRNTIYDPHRHEQLGLKHSTKTLQKGTTILSQLEGDSATRHRQGTQREWLEQQLPKLPQPLHFKQHPLDKSDWTGWLKQHKIQQHTGTLDDIHTTHTLSYNSTAEIYTTLNGHTPLHLHENHWCYNYTDTAWLAVLANQHWYKHELHTLWRHLGETLPR